MSAPARDSQGAAGAETEREKKATEERRNDDERKRAIRFTDAVIGLVIPRGGKRRRGGG